MNDDKTGVRLNEVLGRRRCQHCRGYGYTKGSELGPWDKLECPKCAGTGREAPNGAERRPNIK
jgi:hypothetical protein